MDRYCDGGQDFYEPCMCCGEFGHWAQDCPNNYMMNDNSQRCNQQRGGPEYQNRGHIYNQGYHPRGLNGQREYQDDWQNQEGPHMGQVELDAIYSDVKDLASLVKTVMQRQERQEKDQQVLEGLISQIATTVSEIIGIIKDSGMSSNTNQVDPTHQFSSSQDTDNAHINTVSFPPSFEVSVNEHTPSPRVERVVEKSECDLDQDLTSRTELENKNVKKSLNAPYPLALISPVSTKPEPDPTQDEKWKSFEKRKINLPFLNIIKGNPDNVECLKGLSTQKRRYKCPKQVELSASASVVLLGTLPLELQDPGALVIPIQVGECKVENAFLDLGVKVNILPGSLYDQYDFGPLQRIDTTVLFVDQTSTRPRGIVKDVIVKVGELYYPVNFLVLDCGKNAQPTVILGKPFLATANATVHCAEGTIRLRCGKNKINFKLFSNLSNLNTRKCEIPEKVNHTVKKECVVTNRANMKNEDGILDKGKKRISKRKKRKRKGSCSSDEDEAYMLFLDKFWRSRVDASDDMMKKACKHPTQPP